MFILIINVIFVCLTITIRHGLTLTCLLIGKYDMISKETRKLVLAKYKGLKYD